MTWAWDKEKSESPTGIEPMTSQTPGRHSIHWATRTHGEHGHFYWVHMWQVSCILLGSALPNSSWVVIRDWRWWILSSVIKCEGWNIQSDTSVGQKKSESPTGIEPMTSRTPGGHSIHLATRTHGEHGHFYWVHMWQVSCILLAHTASSCHVGYFIFHI